MFLPRTIKVDNIRYAPFKHFKTFKTSIRLAPFRLFDKVHRKDHKPFFMAWQEFYD